MYRCSSTRSAGSQHGHGNFEEEKACGPYFLREKWDVTWATALRQGPWREHHSSLLPRGAQQGASILVLGWLGGSWVVGWLGPLWILVSVCQMLCDMARVVELRLILRQPSPLWLSFTVEELKIYQLGPKVSDCCLEVWARPFPKRLPQPPP